MDIHKHSIRLLRQHCRCMSNASRVQVVLEGLQLLDSFQRGVSPQQTLALAARCFHSPDFVHTATLALPLLQQASERWQTRPSQVLTTHAQVPALLHCPDDLPNLLLELLSAVSFCR